FPPLTTKEFECNVNIIATPLNLIATTRQVTLLRRMPGSRPVSSNWLAAADRCRPVHNLVDEIVDTWHPGGNRMWIISALCPVRLCRAGQVRVATGNARLP